MREHGSRRECRRWSHSFLLLLLWIFGCVFGVRSKSLSRVTVPGWRREKQKTRASLETTPSPPLFATTSSTTHGFFGVRRKNVIPNRELFDTSERPLFYSKTKCKRDDDQTRWNYRNVCVMLQLRSTCTLFLHLSNAGGGTGFFLPPANRRRLRSSHQCPPPPTRLCTNHSSPMSIGPFPSSSRPQMTIESSSGSVTPTTR